MMRGTQKVILIVDDEERIVRVLKDYLSAQGYGVLTAQDGEQALEIFYTNSTEIDLVLLDVMMPKLDGLATLERLRLDSQVPVIMLTAKGAEYDQVSGFKLGADDYIIKPFSQAVLHLRIQAILSRAGKLDSEQMEFNGIKVDQANRSVWASGQSVELTRREFDLLAYFFTNHQQILSREQILDGVWGFDFEGELRTVDTHVKQLRSKLGSHGSCLKTVFRVGYKMEVSQ